MATSSSPSPLSNFLSLFTQSKPPPPKSPLTNLSLSCSSKGREKKLPSLVVVGEEAVKNGDMMSVVCPSLAYSNTLFFSSGYNVQVIVDENEPEERLIGRFRREVMRAGIIQECKRRKFHENKQDEKKRKTREAAKRNRRRRTQFRPQDKQEATKSNKEEDDEDNWEIPAGQDLPN